MNTLIFQLKQILWVLKRDISFKQPKHMSRDMRFPTMWYVRPQSAHTHSLIRAFASGLNILYATDQTSFGVSKLKKKLHRLV